METFTYVWKLNLYFTLFYLCYWILLRKHTFFVLNRLYLIVSLLLSLALPFFEFTEVTRIITSPNGDLNTLSHVSTLNSVQHHDWLYVILAIYTLGVFYMFIRLLLGLYRLSLILNKGEKYHLEDYTLILLPEAAPFNKLGSFSFFNFLVVSSIDYENYFDTILQHENIHIKQKHSLDIILIELLKIVFWFNPILWFYKHSLREIHEFIADEQVESKDKYASFLVSYAEYSAFGSITNNFFNSFLLKDRIRMIYSESTSYWSLYKYFLIIPIIGITVIKTAAHNHIYVENEGKPVTKKNRRSHYSINTEVKTQKDKNLLLKLNTYTDDSLRRNRKGTTTSKTIRDGNKSTGIIPDLAVAGDTISKRNSPGLSQIKAKTQSDFDISQPNHFNKDVDGRLLNSAPRKLELKAPTLRYNSNADTLKH